MSDWQRVSQYEWYKKGVGTVEACHDGWFGSNSVGRGHLCHPVVGPFQSAKSAGIALELAMKKYLENPKPPRV